MIDNPIHELLDTVSSSAPGTSRISVDQLVRAGRNRQRGVALAATGATVAVVAGAIAVAVVAVPRTSGTAASGSTHNPVTPPVATTAPVPINGPVGAAIPITGASVLNNGKQVMTFLVTVTCGGTPQSRVVSETADEVVLTVALGPTRSPLTGCGPRPTSVVSVPGAQSETNTKLLFDLKQPLGSRQLIDSATGKTIPHTTAEQFAEPASLPAGFHALGAPMPTNLLTWEEFWENDGSGGLALAETANVSNAVSGANTEVNGSPARFQGSEGWSTLEWVAANRLFTLSATQTGKCNPTTSTPATCVPVQPVALALSEQELLRVAKSVQVP